MSCWPPCSSAWCECLDDQCQPSPTTINAVRIKTTDGRYLQAYNGGGGTYLAPVATNTPGPWETFLFEPPAVWPLSSGSSIALRHVTDNWGPSPELVRVEHGVYRLPHKGKKDPHLVRYQIGGEGEHVLVHSGFSAGYPAYPGDDPNERVFTLTKMVGGTPAPAGSPIATGDQVTFSFFSENPNEPIRAWRLLDDVSPAHVDGDGVPGGSLAPSVFTVDFNEVREGVGWRPSQEPCRLCAGVVAHVFRRAGGGIAGAQVRALPPAAPFAGTTPPAPMGGVPDGRVALSAFIDGAQRTCVPAGEIRLQATVDRYQTSTVPSQVPDHGEITVPIPMDCTLVSGKVIDEAGSAVPGVWVFLRGQDGLLLRDENGNPYQAKTDLSGRFTFACVLHGFVKVSTAADPTAFQARIIDPQGWTDVVLVIQSTAGNVTVVVTDRATGAPVVGAQVILTTPSGADQIGTTDVNGRVTFAGVRPAGGGQILVTAPGYLPASVPVNVPATGSRTVSVPLDPDVAVQSPTAFIFQLDWGITPKDLDLHCSGPDQAGGPRIHCFFGSRTPVPYVTLDTDDTNGTGPERITISRLAGLYVPGEYHVWVHCYSTPPPGFFDSGASVTLVSLDGMNLPTQRGRWTVANAQGMEDRLWLVVQITIDANGALTATNVLMTYQAGTSNDVL